MDRQARAFEIGRRQQALLEPARFLELAFDPDEKLLAFLPQPAQLQASGHKRQEHPAVERLLNEVERTLVDGLDQVVIGLFGVARHQNDIDIPQCSLEPAGDLEPGHFRHANVDDRQVRPQALGLFEGRRARRDAGDLMPAGQDAR